MSDILGAIANRMGGGMIAARIRQMTGLHWLVLFSAILLSWFVLYLMAAPLNDLRALGQVYGSALLQGLCTVTPDAAGLGRITAMWALMAAAMMAPTALPALATYDDLPGTGARGFAALVGGYLMVWLGFSVLAAAGQIALFDVGLVDALGESRSALLSAGLLAEAGLYQFSALKQACLSRCRAPLPFFIQHWDEGPLRNGLRMGADCLGCCWALMLLGLVGGVMNLAFMGLATVLMILEKLPDLGRHLTRPLGWALLLGAGAILASLAAQAALA